MEMDEEMSTTVCSLEEHVMRGAEFHGYSSALLCAYKKGDEIYCAEVRLPSGFDKNTPIAILHPGEWVPMRDYRAQQRERYSIENGHNLSHMERMIDVL